MKLNLQLHVHSERSHDSKAKIIDYIKIFEQNLDEDEIGILAITDHFILPLKAKEAYKLSTQKIIVIPGIEWRLKINPDEYIKKVCYKKEIITIGNHLNLKKYLTEKLKCSIINNTIKTRITENELIDYVNENKNLMMVVPHPKHFFYDFYGGKEIKKLYKKIKIPFLIESLNGYDPFPRFLQRYKNYKKIGGSDAHEVKNIFQVHPLF